MSRTDRHMNVKYLEEYKGWVAARYRWNTRPTRYWWYSVGFKHYERPRAERAWNAKDFEHNRAAQKRFWQWDIDKNDDI